MVELEAHRGGGGAVHPFLSNASFDTEERRRTLVPFSSLVPVSAGALHRVVARADANFRVAFGFFGARPVARLALILWVLLLHLIWIFR
jgi:hypothetical protein